MGLREALSAFASSLGGHRQVVLVGDEIRNMVNGLTPEELYRTQPDLRTVVSFIARNVAHLGVPTYERRSDNDRQRLRDDPLPRLLGAPNPEQTRYELFEALVSDLCLYGRAYWMIYRDKDADAGWTLRPIPPTWVQGQKGGGAFGVAEYYVSFPDNHVPVPVKAENMIPFRMWNPGEPTKGSAPLEALRSILAEQVHAWEYRLQVWQRGGRASHVLTRPKDAPWSAEARNKFLTGWRSQWAGKGSRAGGTPVLEDGMDIKQLGFSAREDEWAEVSKVALSKVAQLFHVNPVMIGILDNANFSNTKEFRKMLYSETLGPMLAMIEDRVNRFLVPMVSDSDSAYVEFNIAEKLQGDFAEQSEILSRAVGRPYMLAAEARQMQNLPHIEGTDELVTPLNVLVGGQASPMDGITAGGGAGGSSGAFGALGGLDDAKQLQARVVAATALIRSGFDPVASLMAVGLDPIDHLGLLPVTVQRPTTPDGEVDQSLVTELEKAGRARLLKAGYMPSAHALPPSKSDPVRVKATPGDGDVDRLDSIMLTFFQRQRRVTLSALGSKDAEWWGQERWNRELVDDLLSEVDAMTTAAARKMLEGAGVDPDLYTPERAKAFLRSAIERRAELINKTTFDQLRAIMDGDGPAGADPAHVFNIAEESRSERIGVTLATFIAAFATVEAGKQSGAGSKQWVTTSGNPRPEHAAMNGEAVPVGEKFSNGAYFPGDQKLGVDGVAGCECEVVIVYGASS